MADAERKIQRMLDEIKDRQVEHGEQLGSLRKSLTSVAATQMRHESRFTEIDQRFDEQGEQLKGQDRKLDLIMKALDISAN